MQAKDLGLKIKTFATGMCEVAVQFSAAIIWGRKDWETVL